MSSLFTSSILVHICAALEAQDVAVTVRPRPQAQNYSASIINANPAGDNQAKLQSTVISPGSSVDEIAVLDHSGRDIKAMSQQCSWLSYQELCSCRVRIALLGSDYSLYLKGETPDLVHKSISLLRDTYSYLAIWECTWPHLCYSANPKAQQHEHIDVKD